MSGDTLVALFLEQARLSKNRTALRTKRRGAWEPKTWAEWEERSRKVAERLVNAGIKPGDRIAIFGSTREEWVIADMGVLLAGAVTVPIYHTLIEDQAAYIVQDSGAKIVIAEDVEAAKRFCGGVPVVGFDRVGVEGTPLEVLPPVKADDLACIVYTSGTTGPQKGVMLTHASFAFETASILQRVPCGPADEQLLFLPMAHIFAKILMALQLRGGFATAFAESLAKALDNAQEIEPTFMGCVPRLYEKIFQVANDKAAQEGDVKRRVFAWATDVGRRVAKARAKGERPSGVLAAQHHYADRLVLRKIRHRFGKRLKFAISGGAPLAKELAEWFSGAGVLILEAYGLTETTAGTTINTIEAHRFGTVGRPFPGVEVKIASDGEVLIRGANIMRGYWKKDADTREVLDPDGWFHSGDIGTIDADGFLTITDRKKDIIVTAGGKNVAPQNIENLLKQSPWISQAMVHGDKRAYLVALVTLEPEAMARFAKETGRSGDLETLATDSEVRARVDLEVQAVNRKLSSFETVKKFEILPHDFTVEGGELTPTLKVKRKVVTERYRDLLDRLYA